jgi:phosphoesterase RecJ-like protein
MLREDGRRVDCFFSQQPLKRYDAFRPSRILIDRDVDPDDYDGLVCLDCANTERLDLPPEWDWRRCGLPICNIDHHVDNGRYGQVNYVDDSYASTSQILAHLAKAGKYEVSPATATTMLLGMVTDTGGFRFSNTTASTFHDAAGLLEQGANYELIMDRIFFTEPAAKIRLQGQLLDSVQLACDGRFAYGILTPEMFEACNMRDRDTEGLIDAIRIIEGVDICCLIQPSISGQHIHLSLRSRSAKTPVIDIAHALGGGGHVVAAGATMKNTSLETAIETLSNHVSKILSS